MSNKVNLRVERFSTFIIITYSFFISMTMVISALSYLNGNVLIIKPLLAGVLLPLMFSGWNCAAVNYVGTKKPKIMLEFNLMRFLIRTGNDKAGRPKFKVNKTIAAQYEGQMTERIVTWIHKNPAEAASLGWKELSGDLEKMLKWLSKDPGNTTDEFNTVFSYEEAMNSQLKEVSPGVMYSGSSKDPAVNALLEKLKRDGADSLDSSGFGGQVGGDLQRIMND